MKVYKAESLSRMAVQLAINKQGATDLYGLFSGGHDSLVATHIASKHPLFRGVIHIDTGTGIPATQQFVKDTCSHHGWELHIIKPVTTFEMLIVKYGLPGAAAHGLIYRYLKERPLRDITGKLRSKHDIKGRIALASGVRLQESEVRMHRNMTVTRDGSRVWTPVIRMMSAHDVNDYIRHYNLNRSEVKDRIHLSGECMCGCFNKLGQRQEVE